MKDRMSMACSLLSRGRISKIAHLIALCVLLTICASGQMGQSGPSKPAYAADPANVPDAIDKVRTGQFSDVHIEMIAKSGATEAISPLEKQFALSKDVDVKAHIASALVRLGDQSNTYWSFLMSRASDAAHSDAPSFWDFDQNGKLLPGPSPKFVAWAKASNIPLDVAGEDAMFRLPGAVTLLGITGDRRAIPVLRQALLSPNFMIATQAALGLANVKDNDSIPRIIDICRQAPTEAAAEIATSLVYFDDPKAQSAVDIFIPSDRAAAYRKERANGKTPFGY